MGVTGDGVVADAIVEWHERQIELRLRFRYGKARMKLKGEVV